MSELTLSFIARALESAALPPTPVGRVVTDSRIVRAGDVFVALAGENFDGHDYVGEVLAKGALLCITSRADCRGKTGCLNVADTLAALGILAKKWRKIHKNQTVIAITGSSGKTTVKEMTAAVLRAAAGTDAVLATAGNLNNHIGVPLTLLQLRGSHRFAVIEAGMNHFGELAYLTDIIRPDIALINNALRAHIGCGFDSVADIARAKSEIFQGLAENGCALIPCADAHADIFAAAVPAHARTLSFGMECGTICARDIAADAQSSRFTLVFPQGTAAVTLPAPGRHNVHNAAAAAAAAWAAGIAPENIARGLADFCNTGARLRIFQAAGRTIIDDTYNANPDSMKAAIDVLAAFAAPRALVMGDMGELGDHAPQLHAEIGAYAREKNLEYAFFTGENSRFAAEAFGAKAVYCPQKEALSAVLRQTLPQNAAVLVKGSRFMQMESIVKIWQQAV